MDRQGTHTAPGPVEINILPAATAINRTEDGGQTLGRKGGIDHILIGGVKGSGAHKGALAAARHLIDQAGIFRNAIPDNNQVLTSFIMVRITGD